MERDLTAGSVFKTVIYFSLPYLLSYFLLDIIWYGRFIYSRTVWRCQQYDGGVDGVYCHLCRGICMDE
mgnify:CR=1 FL=1